MSCTLTCFGHLVRKDGKYLGFKHEAFGYSKVFYKRPRYPYVALAELKVREFYEDQGCELVKVQIDIKEVR